MEVTNKQRNISALIMLVLSFVIISASLWGLRLPKSVDSHGPENIYSAQRALTHLGQITTGPSPSGSIEHGKIRRYLIEQLTLYGLKPETQVVEAYTPIWRNGGLIHNVVVRIPGVDSKGALLLTAPYDSAHNTPEASSKSGVAALLEIARLLSRVEPLKNDIIILFSDGGEIGMLGTTAFLQEHPFAEDIGFVVNFGARGMGGPIVVGETSRNNDWLIRQLFRSDLKLVANSALSDINRWILADTSLLVFEERNLQVLSLLFNENPRYYQTSLDNLANFDERSLQHLGDNLYSLVTYFGNLDQIKRADSTDKGELIGGRVYFDILGIFFVNYSERVVAHLLTIMLILAGFICWYGIKGGELTIKGLASGCGVLLALGFGSVLLSSIFINIVLPNHLFYQYIPLHNGLWYFVALLALNFGLSIMGYYWALKKLRFLELVVGGQIVVLLFAAILSLLIPGASYLFVWPVIFNLITTLVFIVWKESNWIASLVLVVMGGLPTLVFWPKALKLLYNSIGMGLVGVIVFFSVLIFGLLLPQLKVIFAWDKRVLPILLLVVFLVCVAVIYTGNKIDKDNPLMDSLFVHINLDYNQAYWASLDSEPDEYTNQGFQNEFSHANLGDLIPYETLPIITRLIDGNLGKSIISNPIGVDIIRDEQTDDMRQIALKITAEEKINNIIVFIEPEILVGEVVLNERHKLAWDEYWPVLRYYNIPPEGITLSIPTMVDQPLEVRILAQEFGLPVELQKSLQPRPDYLIPAPTTITDSTFTIKSYKF